MSEETPGQPIDTDYTTWDSDMADAGIDTSAWRGYSRVPELAALVREWMHKSNAQGADPYAIKEGFLNALHSTSWWQNYAAEWRAKDVLRYNDPGTWNAQHEINVGDVRRKAEALGYTLTNDQINTLAVDWQYFNYTVDEVEREILDLTYYSDGWSGAAPTTGSVKDEYDRLKRLTGDMLVSVSDDWLWARANDINADKTTGNNVDQSIVNMSKIHYDFLEDDMIENLQGAGLTLKDHLNPVMLQLQETWEDSNLDFDDQWVKDNLIVEDEDGNRKFLNASQANKLARQDERYLNTSQNQANMQEFSSVVQRMFGVV